MTVGSVCSGIEAASVAWGGQGATFNWFSEIAPFQARFLAYKYPQVPNVGDLCSIPQKIANGEILPSDIVCGGGCADVRLRVYGRGVYCSGDL